MGNYGYLKNRILTAGITPRPVAFVSSVSEDGVENLGVFSWFNQVSPTPPVISISCTNHPTRLKDTARNIRATKNFTVNIISEAFIENANACAIDAPTYFSEWELTGLTKEPSIHVKAPRVKESAFSMECELFQAIDIVDPKSLKATNTLILGYVKYIHMRKDTMDPTRGIPETGKLKPICRLGGVSYAKLGDGYQIPRPAWANVFEELKEKFGEDAVTDKGKTTEGKL
ncbi:hypothetical protein AGABI1DRAFT_115800 [Agaricus bisporus var. burnettii JB137-S8]|uniref:Flavin reductase like domain-containing protein n=1 Tax=Agaricus bisporus var. burnettii (strain JB137-S8 / ATCC MYA-4627 / FGSC 10392) TaxID=597362 RepID=K5X026_AGABU|nr:uncharacterized protein AGABI1DRAFT_115800 [Agaricus bisporus var. burnettii JB137-S8]EKM76468.1 hypothetical protein AGABI1DRAFT_115800 [Agaricus bisporus var. burnettii JB137-S8]